ADVEVGEVAALGEQVAGRPGADDGPVLDLPPARAVGVDLPAVEVLAVEQRLEAVRPLLAGRPNGQRQPDPQHPACQMSLHRCVSPWDEWAKLSFSPLPSGERGGKSC